MFHVKNPRKQSVRLVHDGAALHQGVCINSVLLQGPDLNNNLRGVLMRFREHPVAFIADVESMLKNFRVPRDQRDYLRFFWYRDNDPNKPLVEYRATVHIFGCTSSPVVATFGLQFCTRGDWPADYAVAILYIMLNFYVDDGLGSAPTAEKAINNLTKAREILSKYGIWLHKIMSNSQQVLNHFPVSERAMSKEDLIPSHCSIQHALGVAWDPSCDLFTMMPRLAPRKFTKRGVVGSVNSVFDPAGLVTPMALKGKLYQREIIPQKKKTPGVHTIGWDELLPEEKREKWEEWVKSLPEMERIEVPRALTPPTMTPVRQELHVFCDASEAAIGHVAYLRTVSVRPR